MNSKMEELIRYLQMRKSEVTDEWIASREDDKLAHGISIGLAMAIGAAQAYYFKECVQNGIEPKDLE